MLRSPLNQGPVHDEGRKVSNLGCHSSESSCTVLWCFRNTASLSEISLYFWYAEVAFKVCQGIFKTKNSISKLEDLWLMIVTNKTVKTNYKFQCFSTAVLSISEFLDICDLNPSPFSWKVKNEANLGCFKWWETSAHQASIDLAIGQSPVVELEDRQTPLDGFLIGKNKVFQRTLRSSSENKVGDLAFYWLSNESRCKSETWAGHQSEMKNWTWIFRFLIGGSLVLRSGDQRSHLVLASFRFAGFIFILYWFSVVVDEWPEGKSEATKRLMGHKERSCIMELSRTASI